MTKMTLGKELKILFDTIIFDITIAAKYMAKLGKQIIMKKLFII